MAIGPGHAAPCHVNGLSGIVLADSLFGTVTEFRQQLAAEGWTYCVGIDSTLKVIAADCRPGAGAEIFRPWSTAKATAKGPGRSRNRRASNSGPSDMPPTSAK